MVHNQHQRVCVITNVFKKKQTFAFIDANFCCYWFIRCFYWFFLTKRRNLDKHKIDVTYYLLTKLQIPRPQIVNRIGREAMKIWILHETICKCISVYMKNEYETHRGSSNLEQQNTKDFKQVFAECYLYLI